MSHSRLGSTPALKLSPASLESSSDGVFHALESSLLTVLEYLSDGKWLALVSPALEPLVTMSALAMNVASQTKYPLGARLYLAPR